MSCTADCRAGRGGIAQGTPMGTTGAADTFHFQIGRFSCLAIRDATLSYPIRLFLLNLPPERYEPWLATRGASLDTFEPPYISLLIDTGRERVLVDTGVGEEFPPARGQLLQHLRAHGIDPGDIDVVVLSHAHADHVGGNLDAHGRPAFPRARYVIGREEWTYWMSNPTLAELPVDEAVRRSLAASAYRNLAGVRVRLDLVSSGDHIVPGITARDAVGHSPGQLALEIASADERLLFVADAVIHPISLEYPDTRAMGDHLPEPMVATRMRLLREAAETRCLVAVSHFPFPGLGRVLANGDRWAWQPIASSAEPR
jgi:glyoxylase-like metal-dependent hydrolase (beta-lactamase superfamily II)